ncbi:MAG: hypothetical protein JW814_02665 [Candidatus Krumholzibacteriota bacterium]|nr:hypothetical protein [Candidatus Krumholzibacteriota bacterium]
MTPVRIKAAIFVFVLVFSIPVAAQQTIDYIVNWSANPEPDIEKYLVYRSFESESGFELIDSVDVNTLFYIDLEREEGIACYYRVAAKNTAGAIGVMSENVSGFTIPDGADQATDALCRISSFRKIDNRIYDVTWTTQNPTIGFLRFDSDDEVLDLTSSWDNSEYRTTHTIRVSDFESEGMYYFRAVSYDAQKNMVISSVEILEVEDENAAPPTAVQDLFIYPVPYNPVSGSMTIDGVPEGGSVTIFNESGLEVWRKEGVESDSTLNWDGNNMNGSPVTSGIYYVVTKSASGKIFSRNPIMVVH